MDLRAYYDAYWSQADDTFDHDRLALLEKHIQPGERVFELDCGPGVLAAKMRDKGAHGDRHRSISCCRRARPQQGDPVYCARYR